MLTNKPKHIFIVEDNQIYSMMLDYILSKDSIYQFVSFKSGEECIENLYMNPDIIILDYGLPGMNGYETLLEIKKRNPKIHVVILSHYDDNQLKKKMLEAGAEDFILKQGHGEKQVIDRIEQILIKDEEEAEIIPVAKKKPFSKILYLILFIAFLTIGLFVMQTIKSKSENRNNNTTLMNPK
jgi:DNA-binding NarL/FixJ family response regulator